MSEPTNGDRADAAESLRRLEDEKLRQYAADRDRRLRDEIDRNTAGNPRLKEIQTGFADAARRAADEIIRRRESGDDA